MRCWSAESLIGFPLEPVCGVELFAPPLIRGGAELFAPLSGISPISPLEPDMGGGPGSPAAGKTSNATKKKAATSRQTHLRGSRERKRRIIHPAESSVATPPNKVQEKLPTRPTGADLLHARLNEANLRGANLTSARLDHADFAGADLTDANLSGASLHHAKNLTRAQLKAARRSQSTILPSHLQGSTSRSAERKKPVQDHLLRRREELKDLAFLVQLSPNGRLGLLEPLLLP
jgi:hypothetical protein